MSGRAIADHSGQHGRDAVAYYFGNPTGHKAELLIYGGLLMQALGSRQVYSPGTLDQIPKYVSATLMFGGALIQPIADVDRTDYLVVVGANPVVSQGSMIVAPGIANQHKGGARARRQGRRDRSATDRDGGDCGPVPGDPTGHGRPAHVRDHRRAVAGATHAPRGAPTGSSRAWKRSQETGVRHFRLNASLR